MRPIVESKLCTGVRFSKAEQDFARVNPDAGEILP